jgi:serine/threonine-protein kinase
VHGWIAYEGRQFDLARQQYEKTLEMDPNYVPALLDVGTNYLRSREYEKAIGAFQKARAAGGDSGAIMSHLAQAYALAGQRARALELLHSLEQPAPAWFVSPWDLAHVYIALGDKAKGIDLLERAANERVGWVILLGVEPAFDSVRGEPRFAKLKQRVGIPA